MLRLGLTVWLCVVSIYSVYGQGQLFPHLEGEILKATVVRDYKPEFVELYTEAREILYMEIYNNKDSVEGIYSGHKVYLPPFITSPIQYLYDDESPVGINTEHIYPRSKGALEINGNAFSDLHNLAPARIEVNSARSNFPFKDIPDGDTDIWFYRDKTLNSPLSPVSETLDFYAEVDAIESYFEGFFEPREQVKGDIARSVFYFYTMYETEALEADPDYFEGMKSDLCQWHQADPVDSLEMERNLKKATYQSGKSNPFILDCTLANRLFCTDNPPECHDLITSLEGGFELLPEFKPRIEIIPNPNSGTFTMDVSRIRPGLYQMNIYSLNGRLIFSMEEKLDYFNTINIWNKKNGIYFLHLINLDNGRKFSDAFQLIRP